MEAPIYKQDGSQAGAMQLPEYLFTLPWADALVHQVVTSIASNQRSGTAHAKGRSEVRGGGRKPWRQKGTDRARHGSIRSPLWVGGGVTFGPSNEKKYTKSINKKMRTKAFFTVLSQKMRVGTLAFLDGFVLEQPSTKTVSACIEKIYGETADKKKNICTVVLSENNEALRKSFANIQGVDTVALESFNVKDALRARNILFLDSVRTIDYLKQRGDKMQQSVGEQHTQQPITSV